MVIAVRNDTDYKSLSGFFLAQSERKTPIVCFTEYPNLTRKRFMEDEIYQEIWGDKKPLIQVRGLIDGENKLVQIINSDGVTEGYMAKGTDLIVDNTSTGGTLKEYGLKELETIMDSSAGLYAGTSCVGWKNEKANEIFELLSGTINGELYFDVKFNVSNEFLDKTREYLLENKLYTDEPTITQGKNYSAINILIPRGKFPATYGALKKEFNASGFVRNEVKQFIG